ncbi:MAG: helix-turn-helix domain-containing protein [Flavobacteriaceae bacterium]|jgi:transposase-like protein
MSSKQKEDLEELKHRVVKLYAEGAEPTTIGNMIGRSRPTIYRWLKEMGVDIKDKRNAKTLAELKDIENEHEKIKKVSEAQGDPAQQYANYAAATAMTIYKNSLSRLQYAKNIRELIMLDQMIRRNLGLEKDQGCGKQQIDINILNNHKGKRIAKSEVIDVPPESDAK